eukprot:2308821-Amphidinium_carterae.1
MAKVAGIMKEAVLLLVIAVLRLDPQLLLARDDRPPHKQQVDSTLWKSVVKTGRDLHNGSSRLFAKFVLLAFVACNTCHHHAQTGAGACTERIRSKGTFLWGDSEGLAQVRSTNDRSKSDDSGLTTSPVKPTNAPLPAHELFDRWPLTIVVGVQSSRTKEACAACHQSHAKLHFKRDCM